MLKKYKVVVKLRGLIVAEVFVQALTQDDAETQTRFLIDTEAELVIDKH